MKLVKIAFTTPVMAIGVALCAALSAFQTASAGTIFVTPDGTGDGLSWANACSLYDALGKVADGDEILLRQGLHKLADRQAAGKSGVNYTYAYGFMIKGGYDADGNQTGDKYSTIISGDPNGTDVWAHYDPETETEELAKVDGAVVPVVKDGQINLPPAYTAKYDVYYPVKANGDAVVSEYTDNICCLMKFTAGSVVFDHLTFTGFGWGAKNSSQGPHIVEFNGKPVDATFQDVALIGLGCYGRMIHFRDTGNTQFIRFRNFEARFCRETLCSVVRFMAGGAATWSSYDDSGDCSCFRNCVFESLYSNDSTGKYAGGLALEQEAGKVFHVFDSKFTRLVRDFRLGTVENTGYPVAVALLLGQTWSLVRDSSFENCWGRANSAMPLMAFRNQYENMPLLGLKIVNNKIVNNDNTSTTLNVGGILCAQKPFQMENLIVASNEFSVSSSSATTASAALFNFVGQRSYSECFGNCSFYDNKVTADFTGDGVVPRVATVCCFEHITGDKGVMSSAHSVNSSYRNNSALPDLYYYGARHANDDPAFVGNSIFSSAAPGYVAVKSEGLGLVHMIDCIAENAAQLDPETVKMNDVRFDDPMLEIDPATGHLKPTVNVEGLQHGSLVIGGIMRTAETHPGETGAANDWKSVGQYFVTNKVYRADLGNYPNGYLCSLFQNNRTMKKAGGNMVQASDATGAERNPATWTLGPLYTTFDGTEGEVLTVYSEPNLGGRVSVPSQAVKGGEKAVAITAIPQEGYVFVGWVDESGETVETAETLSYGSVETYTRLKAVFSSDRKTKLTFSLDGKGVFTATGTDTQVVELDPEDPFPEVPEFTLNPGWELTSWTPAFPEKVPSKDAAYTARLMADYTEFCFDPSALEGDGSGSDWANAVTNLEDAMMIAAGAARSLVKVKRGFWLRHGGVDAKAVPVQGVTLRGGYTGEGDVRVTDPWATVFSGDVKGDDVWVNADGEEVSPVIVGGVFVDPATLPQSKYYKCNTKRTDNVKSLFDGSEAVSVRGFTLEGIAFVGFGRSSTSEFGPVGRFGDQFGGMLVTNCVVAACAQNDSLTYGMFRVATGAEFRNVEFIGNFGPGIATYTASPSGWVDHKVVIKDCLFRNSCATGGSGAGIAVESGHAEVADCRFLNTYTGNPAATCSAALMGGENHYDSVARCAFVSNVVEGVGNANLMGYSLAIVSGGISDCLFKDNVLAVKDSSKDASDGSRYLACVHNDGIVRNCSFVNNRVAGGLISASTVHFGCQGAGMVNCTVYGNVARSASENGLAGTVCASLNCQGFANCTFANNDPANGDILVTPNGFDHMHYNFGVANSIFWSDAEGYRSVVATDAAASLLYLWTYASVFKGIEDFGWTYYRARNCHGEDPQFGKLQWTEDGLHAYVETKLARKLRRGENLWSSDNAPTSDRLGVNKLLVKVDPADPATKYYDLCYLWNNSGYNEADLKGFALEDHDIVDAERPLDGFVRGAVQSFIRRGLGIFVR